jgi:hypothetical protein
LVTTAVARRSAGGALRVAAVASTVLVAATDPGCDEEQEVAQGVREAEERRGVLVAERETLTSAATRPPIPEAAPRRYHARGRRSLVAHTRSRHRRRQRRSCEQLRSKRRDTAPEPNSDTDAASMEHWGSIPGEALVMQWNVCSIRRDALYTCPRYAEKCEHILQQFATRPWLVLCLQETMAGPDALTWQDLAARGGVRAHVVERPTTNRKRKDAAAQDEEAAAESTTTTAPSQGRIRTKPTAGKADKADKAAGGVAVLWNESCWTGTPIVTRDLPNGIEVAAVHLRRQGLDDDVDRDTGAVTVASVYIVPTAKQVDVEQGWARLNEFRPDVVAADWNAQDTAWTLLAGETAAASQTAVDRGKLLARLFGVSSYMVHPPPCPTSGAKNGSTHQTVIDFAVSDATTYHLVGTVAAVETPSDHRMVITPLSRDATTCAMITKKKAEPGPSARSRWRPRARVLWGSVSEEQRARFRAGFAALRTRWPEDTNAETAYAGFAAGLRFLLDRLPRASTGGLSEDRIAAGGPRAAHMVALQHARTKVDLAWMALVEARKRGADSEEQQHMTDAALAALAEYRQFSKTAMDREFGNQHAAAYSVATAWKLWERESGRDVRYTGDIQGPVAGERWTTDARKARRFLDVFAEKYALAVFMPDEVIQAVRAACEPSETEIASARTIPEVTLAEVHAAIRAHPLGKAADPAGLDAETLRELPEPALRVLARIFTSLLRQGVLPKAWKTDVLTPVPKPGRDPRVAANYRPVAVTSVFSRTLERIVLRRLIINLKLPDDQYGFRPGSSVVDPIALFFASVNDAFHAGINKQNCHVAVAAVDFTDAFCHVRPDEVVAALKRLNPADGVAYTPFFRAFLTGRSIAVRVGQERSEPKRVHIGVPQGSVLGPLCWALACSSLIDDLRATLVGEVRAGRVYTQPAPYPRPSKPFCGMAFFADDGICWTAHPDEANLRESMVNVLATISRWSRLQGIEVNADKSRIHVFRRRLPTAARVDLTRDPEAAKLRCGDHMIKVVTEPMRFLGVWFDPALSMTHHVEAMHDECATRLVRLRRIADLLSPATTRVLYVGAILSRLMYAAAAWWNALSETNRKRLQTVHASGARLITGCIESTPLSSLFAEADLAPLEEMMHKEGPRFLHGLLRHDARYPPRRLLCEDALPATASGNTPLPAHMQHGMRPITSFLNSNSATNYEAPSRKDTESARAWLTPAFRPPDIHAKLVVRVGTALFAPSDTAPAERVSIYSEPVEKPEKKKKADLSTAELAQSNASQMDRLRGPGAGSGVGAHRQQVPHWVLATDGAVVPAKDDKPARAAAGAIVVYDSDAPRPPLEGSATPVPRPALAPQPPPCVTAGGGATESATNSQQPPPGTTPTLAGADSGAVMHPFSDSPPRKRPHTTQYLYQAEEGVAGDPRLCSYTAEVLAMATGLRLFLRTVQNAPEARLYAPLFVLTDSQSLLAALARGPCVVEDELLAEIWCLLMTVARERVVRLAFVYSHVGLELNEAADQIATAALDKPRHQHRLSHIDAARHDRSVQAPAEAAADDSEAPDRATFRAAVFAGHTAPKGEAVRLLRGEATPLYRMRVGVDPAFTGWRYGGDARCPLCGDRVGRAQDAPVATGGVAHVFLCNRLEELRATILQRPRIGVWQVAARELLWSDDPVVRKRVIDFRRAVSALQRNPTSARASRLEPEVDQPEPGDACE